MQSILIAVILALAVIGVLLPGLHRDLKATRETFATPRPESVLTRLLKKLKDKKNND